MATRAPLTPSAIDVMVDSPCKKMGQTTFVCPMGAVLGGLEHLLSKMNSHCPNIINSIRIHTHDNANKTEIGARMNTRSCHGEAVAVSVQQMKVLFACS